MTPIDLCLLLLFRLLCCSTYNFWDKDSKQRLKAMAKCSYGTEPAPITCGAFNADGSIYAYALSYDWSKGFQSYNPAQMPNYIHLHGTQEAEVRGVFVCCEILLRG
jgi:mRNA export factor